MSDRQVEGPYLGARLSRRHFLTSAAASVGGILVPLEAFAEPDPIRSLSGKVTLNGSDAAAKSRIAPGDRIVTGEGGNVVFAVGKDAFMVRPHSEFVIEKAQGSYGFLRLVTGALGAVFGKGGRRTIIAANVTAGIRGTGVFLEARSEGTYFCTCWGDVELTSTSDAMDRQVVASSRHVARFIANSAKDGTRFTEARFESHTDEEMDNLEKAVGRRSPILVPRGG